MKIATKETDAGTGSVLHLQNIAKRVLMCATTWEPQVKLLGNVKALELAALAASVLLVCPLCSGKAWVNDNCEFCDLMKRLLEKDQSTFKETFS